jgi:hypothetical protein
MRARHRLHRVEHLTLPVKTRLHGRRRAVKDDGIAARVVERERGLANARQQLNEWD